MHLTKTKSTDTRHKHYLVLIIFIVLKIALQYFGINSVYELHRDEFLHLDLGRHLAFGYTSVPPLTGLLSGLIYLLGNTVFWVKFFPTLFGILLIYVVWKVVLELGGNLFAAILALTSVLFSIFIRLDMLYQPNSLDTLCWTLVLYYVIKYLHTENDRWLYFAAVSFAVGFLNKYNIGFLILGLIPSFLLTTKRKIIINKHLYYSAGIALLLISPNLIWQLLNGFPVFQHLRTLSETQLINVSRLDFLKEQLYFFPGSLFIIFFGFLAVFTHKGFKDYRLLFFTFVFTMSIFTILRAKNYYSAGLYPVFIALGAVYLEKLLSGGGLKYLRIPVLLIPVAAFIPILSLILPFLTPQEITDRKESFDKFNLTRWEDGKLHNLPQDYADMLGWKELSGIVDSALTLVDEKELTVIQCDNYGQAGAINFYSNETIEPAVSLNADYINWYPLDKFEIKHVILVKEANDSDKDRLEERPFFDEVSLIGEIKNPFARETGTRVYLLKGAKLSVNSIVKSEIAERKNRR